MSDFFKKYAATRGERHVQKLQLEGTIAAQIKTTKLFLGENILQGICFWRKGSMYVKFRICQSLLSPV